MARRKPFFPRALPRTKSGAETTQPGAGIPGNPRLRAQRARISGAQAQLQTAHRETTLARGRTPGYPTVGGPNPKQERRPGVMYTPE